MHIPKLRNAREGAAAIYYTEIPESNTNIVIEMRLKHFRLVSNRRDTRRLGPFGMSQRL